jgi:ubiquinone/menaquinone biosynthesis C-methylase UbiE
MAGLQPGEMVVDIACGTGLVTFPAAEAVGERGEVVGTDLSGAMVEMVSGQAKRLGLQQARFERMGAEQLDLDDASFDAALCGLGLMYVPSPVAAVGEMLRVVRPGGRAVAAVWGQRDRCGWAEIFPIVDSRVRSEVCPMFFQLGTGEALTMLFEQVGFVDVETERLTTVLEYEAEEDALGAAFDGGPVAMAYSRFDESTKEAAHAEYLQSIEPYRNESSYQVPGEFVIVAGRKAE